MQTDLNLTGRWLCLALLVGISGARADDPPVVYYDFEGITGSPASPYLLTNKATGATLEGFLYTDDVIDDQEPDGILRNAGSPTGFVPSRPTGVTFDRDNEDWIETGFTAAELNITGNRPEYTFAAWVYLGTEMECSTGQWPTTGDPNGANPGQGDAMVFGQMNQNSSVLHHGVRCSGITDGEKKYYLGHWSNDLAGNSVVVPEVWRHVVWRVNKGQQAIFVDGVLDKSQIAGVLTNAAGEIVIGRTGMDTQRSFGGTLDDVAIWDKALTLNQIMDLAAGGDPNNLPAAISDETPEYFTMPTGPGGSWNLYALFGNNGLSVPDAWYYAHQAAIALPDPSANGAGPGHLAYIDDSIENAGVRTLLPAPDNGVAQPLWLGKSDNEIFNTVEGEFVLAPDELVLPYLNWTNGQPDDGGTSGIGEDAVQMDSNGQWSDQQSAIPGSDQDTGPSLAYLVEWDTGAAAPVTITGESVEVVTSLLDGVTLPTLPVTGGKWSLREYRGVGTIDNIEDAIEVVASGLGTTTDSTATVLNFSDPDSPGHGGLFRLDELTLPGEEAGFADASYVVLAQAMVTIPADGYYSFMFRGDDGGMLRIEGANFVNGGNSRGTVDIFDPEVFYHAGPTSDSRSFARSDLLAGEYLVSHVHFSSGGASHFEVSAVAGNVAQTGHSFDWRLINDTTLETVNIPTVTDVAWDVWSTVPMIYSEVGPTGDGEINNIAEANTYYNSEETQGGAGSSPGDLVHAIPNPDVIDYVEERYEAYLNFPVDALFPDDQRGPEDDFVVKGSATLEVPVTDFYDIGFSGNEGGYLRMPAPAGDWNGDLILLTGGAATVNNGADRIQYDGTSSDSTTVGRVYLEAGVQYPIDFLCFDRATQAGFEVFGGQDMVFDLIEASATPGTTKKDSVFGLIIPGGATAPVIESISVNNPRTQVTLNWSGGSALVDVLRSIGDLGSFVKIADGSAGTFTDSSAEVMDNDRVFYAIQNQ